MQVTNAQQLSQAEGRREQARQYLANLHQDVFAITLERDRWKKRYNDLRISTMLITGSLCLIIIAMGWAMLGLLQGGCR